MAISTMNPLAFVFVIFLYFCAPLPTTGYPNGRVTKVCDSMIPEHGHNPQSEPQHTINVDKTAFKPRDRIKVTLSGSRFTGFFVQARDAANLDGDTVGSFLLIDDQVSQLLTCGNVENSAVSHTSKQRKQQVEFYWIAPDEGPQHIQFIATVVQKYKIYWVKIKGPVISQTNALPIPTGLPANQSSTRHPDSLIAKPFTSSGCGRGKFCIRNPSDCEPENTPPQCFFLSFTIEKHSVLVEMSGPGQGYISFAFSHDQWMGDDDAYLCVKEDQKVQINPAYLRGRTPPEVASQELLQDVAWRLADGVIQCSFRRAIKIPAVAERFDLSASHYIFLADGDAEDGRIYRHHRQPLMTSRRYNITGIPEDVGGSRSPLLIKYHGALMFMAWMTTVSIGVIVARFFKPVWSTSSLFGQMAWFQIHRILMVTTVILTSIAFVLPFLYRGHWSNRAGYHPYLGCTVMALTILQPLLAILRPPPYAPRRSIFNWTHWGFGTIARIIAVAAMFLGMDIQALDLPDPWDTYTMIGFVLWHVFVDLLLEIHGFCILQREYGKMEDDQVEILRPSHADNEGHTFKKIVLTIYICGNFAFLITFLAAIYQI
ncbi:putative ferric-chelate reductase 1 [Pelodytes ibericus]